MAQEYMHMAYGYNVAAEWISPTSDYTCLGCEPNASAPIARSNGSRKFNWVKPNSGGLLGQPTSFNDVEHGMLKICNEKTHHVATKVVINIKMLLRSYVTIIFFFIPWRRQPYYRFFSIIFNIYYSQYLPYLLIYLIFSLHSSKPKVRNNMINEIETLFHVFTWIVW